MEIVNPSTPYIGYYKKYPIMDITDDDVKNACIDLLKDIKSPIKHRNWLFEYLFEYYGERDYSLFCIKLRVKIKKYNKLNNEYIKKINKIKECERIKNISIGLCKSIQLIVKTQVANTYKLSAIGALLLLSNSSR